MFIFSFYKINYSQMVCSILLHTVCQATSTDLEYEDLTLLPFWQYNFLTSVKKRGNTAAVFTAAYMPISRYLVICKKDGYSR